MNTLTLAVAAYMLLQFCIAAWVSRRIHNEADYLVAGRSLGPLLATFSLFATWFGAETVMGSSAAVAEEGLAGSRADPFGYTICLVLMAVFLAYRMRAHGFVTLGDFFRKRFNHRVELLAVAIYIPSSLFWSSAQLLALGVILNVVTGASIAASIVGATLLVLLYTTLGGMMSDVINDFVQGGVIILGLALLLVFVFARAGGVGAGLAMIEPSQLHFTAPGESVWGRLDTWMIPILGSLVSQEALSRVFATRSPEIARRASFQAAAIYLVIGVIPVLVALIGSHFDQALSHRDQFLPQLARQLLPAWCYVIFVGALIAAILSTVDSTMLSVSSLMSHNILNPMFPEWTEAQKVRAARCCVVVSGLVSMVLALSGDNIYALVENASSFGSAGIFVTVMAGLYVSAGGNRTAAATLLTGIVTTAAFKFIWPLEAPFLTSVGCSLGVYVLGCAAGRRRLQWQPA